MLYMFSFCQNYSIFQATATVLYYIEKVFLM